MFSRGHHRLAPPEELFDQYGAMVYRRCRALLGDEDLARDAVQAVFLRVLERRDSYRAEASPMTWLYSIATLHCFQLLRNRSRRERGLVAEGHARSEAHTDPLEDRLTVAALLDDSDSEVRQMVFLRHVDGMTVEEVAEAVGFSRKTVAKKLQKFFHSARVALGAGVEP